MLSGSWPCTSPSIDKRTSGTFASKARSSVVPVKIVAQPPNATAAIAAATRQIRLFFIPAPRRRRRTGYVHRRRNQEEAPPRGAAAGRDSPANQSRALQADGCAVQASASSAEDPVSAAWTGVLMPSKGLERMYAVWIDHSSSMEPTAVPAAVVLHGRRDSCSRGGP